MSGEVLILDYFGAALNIVCQQASKGAPIPIGESTRAWAGNERTSSRGEKRTWNIRTTKIPKPMERLIQQLIARRNQIYMAGEAIDDNPVIDSLNLASPQWIRTTVGLASGILDPFNQLNAQTVTASAAHGLLVETLTPGVGMIRTNSIWLKRRTGAGAINLILAGGAGALRSANLPLTSNWQQYSASDAVADNTRYVGLDIAVNGDAVDAYGAAMTGEPILCSAVCNSSDMQEGTYLYEMSLTIFEV